MELLIITRFSIPRVVIGAFDAGGGCIAAKAVAINNFRVAGILTHVTGGLTREQPMVLPNTWKGIRKYPLH